MEDKLLDELKKERMITNAIFLTLILLLGFFTVIFIIGNEIGVSIIVGSLIIPIFFIYMILVWRLNKANVYFFTLNNEIFYIYKSAYKGARLYKNNKLVDSYKHFFCNEKKLNYTFDNGSVLSVIIKDNPEILLNDEHISLIDVTIRK